MGAITIDCPNCGQSLSIPPQYSGQRGTCRHCKNVFTAPVFDAQCVGNSAPISPPKLKAPKNVEQPAIDTSQRTTWLALPFRAGHFKLLNSFEIDEYSAETLRFEIDDTMSSGISKDQLNSFRDEFAKTPTYGNLPLLAAVLATNRPLPVIPVCAHCMQTPISGYAVQKSKCTIRVTLVGKGLAGASVTYDGEAEAGYRWPLCLSCYTLASCLWKKINDELGALRAPLVNEIPFAGVFLKKAKLEAEQKLARGLYELDERISIAANSAHVLYTPIVLPSLNTYHINFIVTEYGLGSYLGGYDGKHGAFKATIASIATFSTNLPVAQHFLAATKSDKLWESFSNRQDTNYPIWKHLKKYPCNAVFEPVSNDLDVRRY